MDYSKQFNKHRTEHFARLIQSIDFKSFKSQEDYEKTIENVYMTMFRHNIQGQFVYENPNPNAPDDESWLVGETYNDDDRKKTLDIIHNRWYDSIITKKGLIMKLTQNDITKLENQAFYIYQEFQATMAGQTMSDVDALQRHFEEVAAELGEDSESLWDKCESFHEQYINR